jgi:hypothetical protein
MNKECLAILKETILNSIGLNGETQVQIKGDPTMRESAFNRHRQDNIIDNNLELVQDKLLKLALHTGCYHIELKCNNNKIITRRVLDPLVPVIHDVEKFMEDGYIDRQFPAMEYNDKIEAIKDIHKFLNGPKMLKYATSKTWREIREEKSKMWNPMETTDIINLVASIKPLRELDDFYLREMTLCLCQNAAILTFNCDGTTILRSTEINNFIEENI